MKKILFGSIISSLFIFSCSKSDNPVTPEADHYMSTSAGSKWTYDVITNPGTPTSTTVADTVTISGGDTTVESGTANQRTYLKYHHTNGNTTDYYNITGNDYYRFQALGLNNGKIQNLYLKDNAAVGTSWSQSTTVTVPGVGDIPVTVTNSVTEKGISKTVNGIAYNNVFNIKTDISSAGLPAGTIVSDIKSYYAPKAGLIEGDYKITIALAGIDVNTQTLLKTSVTP